MLGHINQGIKVRNKDSCSILGGWPWERRSASYVQSFQTQPIVPKTFQSKRKRHGGPVVQEAQFVTKHNNVALHATRGQAAG